MELHGGSVRVKSAGENQGSTFVVALPISQVRAEDTTRELTTTTASTDPLETIQLPRLDAAKVLIVDDDQDGCTMLTRILEERGARPTCAASAREALEHMRQQHFDILLSDIGMPDVDGYELLKRVRVLDASRPSPIPAVAITAYARPQDRQRSLLAGCNMRLTKPIEAPEPVAAMAGLLRLTR